MGSGTHKPDLSALSITQLADLTGAAEKTVIKRLRAAGVDPIRENGRTLFFAPPVALPVILMAGNGLNPAAEKARKDRADADLKELELAKRKRELLEADEVVAGWSALVLTWKERIRGVAAVATVRIPGFSKPMARTLLALVDETLTELADGGSSTDRRRTGKPARRRKAKSPRASKASA